MFGLLFDKVPLPIGIVELFVLLCQYCIELIAPLAEYLKPFDNDVKSVPFNPPALVSIITSMWVLFACRNVVVNGILEPAVGDESDLVLDRFAGVLVVAGAVAGDEERRPVRPRAAAVRRRMLLHHVAGAGEDHLGHARVGTDRSAVMKRLRTAPLDTRETRLAVPAEAELARDDLLGEVAFADEQRHDEDPRRGRAAQDAGEGRMLLPEALDHLCEDAAAAQFIGMLEGRRRRIGVQRRTMAREHERGVGEVGVHRSAEDGPERRRCKASPEVGCDRK